MTSDQVKNSSSAEEIDTFAVQGSDRLSGVVNDSAKFVDEFLIRLQSEFNFKFQNPEILNLALIHKSFRNEHRTFLKEDNERFEFLGDAVLSLALSDLLMSFFPEQQEGVLSKRRASLVNEETLAEIAIELKLDAIMKLGKGEEASGGARKPRLLASTLEALFASMYRDQGMVKTTEFISQLYSQRLASFSETTHFQKDYKTRLQELLQQVGRAVPLYNLISSEGPEHEKIFLVEVLSGDEVLGTGQGRSKKNAEQESAKEVLTKLEEGRISVKRAEVSSAAPEAKEKV